MTKVQESAVRGQVRAKLSAIFSDFGDLESITDAVTDDVIDDINETADWSDLDTDEVVMDDINIALARVLMNRIFND